MGWARTKMAGTGPAMMQRWMFVYARNLATVCKKLATEMGLAI